MVVAKVVDLHKTYRRGFIPRKQKVLNGIHFSIAPGTITGFLGGNGAGKTTALKCILGLAFPDSGEVSFFDGQPLSAQIRQRIGFLPERPYFYDYLTGEEFLDFFARLSLRLTRPQIRQRITGLLKRVDLEAARNKPLRTYSKGMLQRVGIAQALIHDPEFVILDEPMSGLDPDGRHAVAEIIRETASKGTAVFFSSHLLNDAERLCDNLVILAQGKTIYEGTTEKLLARTVGKIEIVYLFEGQPRQSMQVSSESEVQQAIDQLRRQNATISEVRPLRRSLEEVFVEMALRWSSKP